MLRQNKNPITIQKGNGMKRKNDNNSQKGHEENFDFLDDRMQLLDTVRQMIDIAFERRGMKSEGNPHPENPPPANAERKPPGTSPHRPTFWQRLMHLFS